MPKGRRGINAVYQAIPLDFELLAMIPERGQKVGGVYELHRTAHSLGKSFDTPGQVIAGRLREMKAQGWLVNVPAVGTGPKGGFTRSQNAHGWQRTPKGTAALSEHQKGERES